MSISLDDLLEKLEGVTPSGSGFVALCPAHGDSEPSLSVGEGEERLLLNCLAGCTQDEVLKAIGLTWRDIVYKAGPNFDATPDAVYPYVDEAGNVLFEAVRMPGKKFRQRHLDPENPDAKAGGYVWNLDGVRRVMYRLPELIQTVADGKTVYLVEGEKDALRFTEETGKFATTLPMGAGKWRDEYTPFFMGAKQVIIIQDRDEPGRRHAQKVSQILGAIGVPVLILQSKEGKDVSDHFDAGHDLTALVKPRATPKRGIVTMAESYEASLEYLNYRPMDLPGYPLIAGVEASIVRPGRLYAGGAYTGDGKTTIALQGTRNLTAQGVRTGYFTLEMSEADLRNRLIAQKGIPLHLLEQPWLLKAEPAMNTLYHEAIEEMRDWPLEIIYDTHLKVERVVEEIRDREYEFVIIDHLHRLGFGDRRHLEEQIKTLTNVTLDANITMLVLCQLRRYQRGKDMVAYPPPLLQDFRETEVIGNEASLAFAVWRQRDQEGLSYVGDNSQFRVLKNRYVTSPRNQSGHIELMTFDRTTQLFATGGLMSEAQVPTGKFTTPYDEPWEGADDGLDDTEWD